MAAAVIILILAVPLSGILLMRFRKRSLARFNLAVTNRITGRFAGWLPGFGINKKGRLAPPFPLLNAES